MNSCLKFIKKQYSVKITVQFKGRENARPEIGETLLNKFVEIVSEENQKLMISEIMVGQRSRFLTISPSSSGKSASPASTGKETVNEKEEQKV